MIKADFVTEVRQLIANHVGDCKGEGRDIILLFYLLPPLWSFPQFESSDFFLLLFSLRWRRHGGVKHRGK